MRIPAAIRDALEHLDVWDRFVDVVQTSRNEASLEFGLAGLRRAAANNFRQQALCAHPDLGGDTERMQVLNDSWEAVRRLEIEVPDQSSVSIHIRAARRKGALA